MERLRGNRFLTTLLWIIALFGVAVGGVWIGANSRLSTQMRIQTPRLIEDRLASIHGHEMSPMNPALNPAREIKVLKTFDLAEKGILVFQESVLQDNSVNRNFVWFPYGESRPEVFKYSIGWNVESINKYGPLGDMLVDPTNHSRVLQVVLTPDGKVLVDGQVVR